MCERAFVIRKMQLDQQLPKGDVNYAFVSSFILSFYFQILHLQLKIYYIINLQSQPIIEKTFLSQRIFKILLTNISAWKLWIIMWNLIPNEQLFRTCCLQQLIKNVDFGKFPVH